MKDQSQEIFNVGVVRNSENGKVAVFGTVYSLSIRLAEEHAKALKIAAKLSPLQLDLLLYGTDVFDIIQTNTIVGADRMMLAKAELVVKHNAMNPDYGYHGNRGPMMLA